MSLVHIAMNSSVTPSTAVWPWSQILFCSVCASCISGKDFHVSLGKRLPLLHILVVSLSLSVTECLAEKR